MPEIRQIRVGGVTYDVVASEDEVAASRAQQYATQAQNSATLAGNYKDTAGHYATTAKNYQEECLVQVVNANDAADRAEAIVGGQFVSYGQDQGLSAAYKYQARKNIDAIVPGRNLLNNTWFGDLGKLIVHSSGPIRYIDAGQTGSPFDCWTKVTSDGYVGVDTELNIIGGAELRQMLPTDVIYSLIEKADRLYVEGKTLPMCLSYNQYSTVYSGTFNMPRSTTSSNVIIAEIEGSNGKLVFGHTSGDSLGNGNGYYVSIISTTGQINVDRIKFEVGSYSTIENDVPPDMVEETFKSAYSTGTGYYVDSTTSQYEQLQVQLPSNKNLLDNPFFTVNQRNFTSVNYTDITTPTYIVDRWLFGGVGTCTYNSDKSITVTITNPVWGGLTQRFSSVYKGLNVTFSVMLTDGTVVSGNGIIPPASGANIYPIYINGYYNWQVLLRSDGSTWWMELRCSTAGATLNIKAIKLELGNHSTLVNDTIPDYGQELFKCISSTADSTDPYANTGFGRSNRNLLDNPWWGSGEVVNQRNITSTPANQAYCIDRWIYSTGSGSNAISLGANGITFTPVSGQYIWMNQHMANASWFTGKTVTGSIMLADGTIYSGTVKVTTGNDYMYFNDSVGFRFYWDISNNVVLRVGTTKTIRALKVELGSYSTLANDVPPDYKTELDKCQYRCVVYDLPGNFLFCRGIATSSTNIRGIIDLPTSMAGDRTPTISLTGSLTTPQGNTITAITAANTARNNKLAVNCTVSSVTSGNAYDIFTGSATPKIVISADL